MSRYSPARSVLAHPVRPLTAVTLILTFSCGDRENGAQKRAPATFYNGAVEKSRDAAAPTAPQELSPKEVVRSVHESRVAGQLGKLAPHLVPEQRPAIIDLIQAVDELTHADRVLHAAAVERLGSASAQLFDHSAVADSIGVFSRRVEILREEIQDEHATVDIQVADRVPLQRVPLERIGGEWLIRTDPPIPGLSTQLHKLAEILIDAARGLERHRWTAEQLRAELTRKQTPVLKRIKELTNGDGR